MVCVYLCATHEYALSSQNELSKLKKEKKEESLADVLDVSFF
jgi:hypothetical protein